MPYNQADSLTLVVEAKRSGVWSPITTRALSPREARGVRVKHGRSEGAIQAEASRLWLSLDNDDGLLTPGDPRSEWFGTWGEGTPIRCSVTGILGSPAYLGCGQIEEIDPVYPGGPSSSVNIMAMGALGVFLRSADPPAAPTARFMRYTAPTPLAWWPLAAGDERQTQSSPSGLPGGAPLIAEQASAGSHRLTGVVGGAAVGPLGAPVAIDLSDGGQLRGTIPAAASNLDPWRAEVAFKFATPTTSSTSGQILHITYRRGDFTSDISIFGTEVAGAELELTMGSTFSDTASVIVDDGDWHHLRLDAVASGFGGLDFDYELAIDGVVAMSGTATGKIGGAPREVIVAPTGDLGAASNLVFWSDTLPATNAGYDAFIAHAGERQLDRVQRVADEEGITITIHGTVSPVMGPQAKDTTVGILMACEGMGGMLFDAMDEVELVFRAHDDLINQTPRLNILHGTWTPETKPIWSSRGTVNDVTVSRTGGATREFEDAEHIARTQRRIRGGGSFNAATDDQLGHFGGWLLHQGTSPDPRYPQAGWNLRNEHGSAHADNMLAMQPGDRITAAATSFPDVHPVYGADQIVAGWAAEYDTDRWEVFPVLTPAGPYLPGTIGDDDTAGSWLQTGPDTRLASGLAAGATSASVTVDGPLFDTDNTTLADNPLTVVIGGPGGERCPVTDISGGSSPQTLTITRTVARAWAANSPVQVYLPLALTI